MSEITQYPDGWHVVKFGDVVTDVNRTTRDPITEGLNRIVGLDHMDSESLPLRRWDLLKDLPDGTSFTRTFRSGQVLFGKRRAYQRKVSVPEFDGICSSDILVFETASPNMLQRFLPYLVQSNGFFEHALGTSAGSLSPRTKWQELAKYEFALPPVAEQRAIVELLSTVDEVNEVSAEARIAADHFALCLRNAIARSGFECTLGELTAVPSGVQIGPFGSQLHSDEYSVHGVPVVMPSDLRRGWLDTSQVRRVSESTATRLAKHRLEANDILLPRRGELDKRTLVGAEEVGWLCGTGTVRVRLKDPGLAELVIEMLAEDCCVGWLKENAVGTTMPNLNTDIVNRIPVRLPVEESWKTTTDQFASFKVLSGALELSASARKDLCRSLREASLSGTGHVQRS